MKLFLSSTAISRDQEADFIRLVGKKRKDIIFALIENAADPYTKEKRSFVIETRSVLKNMDMQIERIDLRLFKGRADRLYEKLCNFDVVWVGGGDTFYLRWLMKECGFDEIVQKLLKNGVVYGGGSAGAIVAGPTLDAFDLIDNSNESPEVLRDGLHLYDFILIPHWKTEEFQKKLEEIRSLYEQRNFHIFTLTDDQAIIIDGNERRITPTHVLSTSL